MQIKFLDNLDKFLRSQLGDGWNYTYEASKKEGLQIIMNVWLENQEEDEKPKKPVKKLLKKVGM